ncbi:helix-turn-helix domain-containing protein [Microbacterium sp. USHLN272]|uniref:helix-turn-helix domain-containing protein n=1 Tax=Microbacterium sp. USHLN272 TaxID=3081287 RepID=UPI00301A6043
MSLAVDEPQKRFYFVNEVATELRRSEASIRWMIHTGQIKTGKIGGRIVVAAAEIDRLISEAFAEAG